MQKAANSDSHSTESIAPGLVCFLCCTDARTAYSVLASRIHIQTRAPVPLGDGAIKEYIGEC